MGARLALAVMLVAAVGCDHTEWQAEFTTPSAGIPPMQRGDFLKVHMISGGLFVLDRWRIEGPMLVGEGLRYDSFRTVVDEGVQNIPLADVALLETNRPRTVAHAGPPLLGVVTALSLVVTAACIAEPKACFGSCPTFYADDGRGMALQAEGFSSSIARVLEQTDVDALQTAVAPDDGRFELVMRNEALETHRVRHVDLIAVPRPESKRILRDGDRYFVANEVLEPASCADGDEDCRPRIATADGVEHTPRTDPHDLGARHVIELAFPEPPEHGGVVISGRYSLVSTFLLYQFLAYLGSTAGEWLVALDSPGSDGALALAPRLEHSRELYRDLARISVEVRSGQGQWRAVGAFDEAGPIARDRWVLPLPDDLPPGPLTVRLDLARGFWKLDQVALADLGPAVEPVRVRPSTVMRDGRPDAEARRRLLDPDEYLTTLPREDYTLVYELPAGDHELFVESRGYYYEWIREVWLEDESSVEAARVLLDPASTLRRLAPAYKRIEEHVDRAFWQSRVGGPR